MALLLGYDVGSSSIKATLMDAQTGKVLASATSPEKELEIIAKELGWAEQHPQTWWEHVKTATSKIKAHAEFAPGDVGAIGISYQMHGLVVVDENKEVLRPSIIWCDSRAVEIGEQAAKDIGPDMCLKRLFNLPGNFTASKLKWVKENEPQVFAKIHKMMLPGDYVAMKMTGEIKTTPSGLSEGIMWDFESDELAEFVVFVHVNHSKDEPRYGVLLCLNGTGILNSWLKHNFVGEGLDYPQMNELAAEVPVGSDGLVILPYGNGAERTLENRNIGASVHGWSFNVHKKPHFLRAAQEGIVFALNYGLGIMRDMGIELKTVKAGNANMFLSPLFAEAFATVTGASVQLFNTDGSQGAARGAGIGTGIYKGPKEAFTGLKPVKTINPNEKLAAAYKQAYEKWEDVLKKQL